MRNIRNITLSGTIIFGLLCLPTKTSGRPHNVVSVPGEPVNVTADTRLGWTGAPNYRGTLDILWNSALTIFLCCWSILILNVAAPDDTWFTIFRRKLILTVFTCVAAEFILGVSLAQYLSAQKAKTLFHASDYKTWTLTHSFYAEMGGLLFQTPDYPAFVIDGRQLHYLVVNEYVEYPKLNDDAIRDKNKADPVLRFITLVQVLWFCINVALRAASGLAITTLELTTAAFVISSTSSTIFWLKKPADVMRPKVLFSKDDTTMAQILKGAGDEARDLWYCTPLDFVSREEWSW